MDCVLQPQAKYGAGKTCVLRPEYQERLKGHGRPEGATPGADGGGGEGESAGCASSLEDRSRFSQSQQMYDREPKGQRMAPATTMRSLSG